MLRPMTDDLSITGDVDRDDVALQRGHDLGRRTSSPYVVVTSVAPHVARRFDEAAELLEAREHIGPFADRRSAERWARSHYADKPAVAWTTAQVRGPAWVEEDVRRLRAPAAPTSD